MSCVTADAKALRFKGWDGRAKTHGEIIAKLTSPLVQPTHVQDQCSLRLNYSMENMIGAEIVIFLKVENGPSFRIKTIPKDTNTT